MPRVGRVGALVEHEPRGEQLRPADTSLRDRGLPSERALAADSGDELPVRLGDVLPGLLDVHLYAVERVHDVRPAAERPGQVEHVFDVPVRVVVRIDASVEVVPATGGGEIPRGGVDRILGVPGVGHAVAGRVGSPALPGRGHELHPADRACRARAHVPAEVRLDLVDRGEHFPRNPVGGAGLAPERAQGAERQALRLAAEEHGWGKCDRAWCVRHLGARKCSLARLRDDPEDARLGACRCGRRNCESHERGGEEEGPPLHPSAGAMRRSSGSGFSSASTRSSSSRSTAPLRFRACSSETRKSCLFEEALAATSRSISPDRTS